MNTYQLLFAKDILNRGDEEAILEAMLGEDAENLVGVCLLVDRDMLNDELDGPNEDIAPSIEKLIKCLDAENADLIALEA